MSSVKDYPTLTKVFLKKLGINKKCHPEMIVSNKLNDKYIVMCSYCMRREYIKKHLRHKMKNNLDITKVMKNYEKKSTSTPNLS